MCGIERPDRLDQYIAAAADAAAQAEHLWLEDVDDARHADAEVVYIGVDHLHGGLVARVVGSQDDLAVDIGFLVFRQRPKLALLMGGHGLPRLVNERRDTIYNMALNLKHKALKGVQIVQLKGGISHSQSNTYAYEVVELFSEAFSTVGRYLPLPVMFDTAQIKELIERDKHIKKILDLGRQANIAVFTVGTVKNDALLFRLGYIDKKDRDIIQNRAVGDICSRFIDAQGNICDKELDERTVGIKLEDLKEKEKRVLVAGSKRKISAIKATLVGEIANILITDQYTAQELLK